jgi:uncharacterized protein DUF262
MNIASLLNQIKTGEIVLPAIQRNFVWSIPKILRLMDSIMRNYPIGIILMWETYNEIQYRKFDEDFKSNTKLNYHENDSEKRLKIVLDGQQRLQSLYIAIYGSHDKKHLYFDLMSGLESDDFEEEKYVFDFMSKSEAKMYNQFHIDELKTHMKENPIEEYDKEELEYYIKVSDLFNMNGAKRQKIRKEIIKKYYLNEDEENRLEGNISKLNDSLSKEQNIIQSLVIDENKSFDGEERQSESDILEIFVRINRQGTPLSRSDLVFSMLKLQWKDSATALPEFVEKINRGNSLALDIDFVVRCLFVVSDLGAKFDVDILRKKSNVEKITENYDKCVKAIKSTLDYVQQECWVSSSKALGGNQNLIPFVYYLFHCPSQRIPKNAIDSFRKSFFLLAFAGPFSRWGDSRISNFVRTQLRPSIDSGEKLFPFDLVIKRVAYWEKISCWDRSILNNNPRLALSLLQGGMGDAALSHMNQREMDHIFPRSVLYDKGFDDRKINDFANYWLLTKDKNINKTNKLPKDYFNDVSDSELKRAYIQREYLKLNRFNTFLKERGDKMFTYVTKKIAYKTTDWDVLND